MFLFRLSLEKDLLEKESREKETKILNMQRELDELRDSFEKSDRNRLFQQRELEDLMSSKDDVGKSVCIYTRQSKRFYRV